MWGFDDESIMDPTVKLYEALYNVKVNYVKKDKNEYEQESLSAIAAGKGPDIWTIDHNWVYKHNDKLVAMPERLLEKSKDDTRPDLKIYSDMFPTIVEKDNIIGDKIYGLPLSIDTLALYINKDIFEKKQSELIMEGSKDADLFYLGPNNWDDFLKISKMLTQKEGNDIKIAGTALGTSQNVINSSDILELLMMQNKANMVSADNKTATFNLPITKQSGDTSYPGTSALEFYTSFSYPQKENYMWNESMPDSATAFLQGKVAMIFHYKSFAKRILQEAPNLNYKVSALPQIKGETNAIDYAKYDSLTVTNNSKNSDAAWQFIKYLYSESSDYYSSTNSIKAQEFSALVIPQVQIRNSHDIPFEFQQASAGYFFKGKFPEKIDNVFYQMIDYIVKNKEPYQKAIDKAAASATTLYQQSAALTQ